MDPEGMIDPKTLPEDHILRNTPLRLIGAINSCKGTKKWSSVEKFLIGPKTYNDLRGPWIEFKDWRVLCNSKAGLP